MKKREGNCNLRKKIQRKSNNNLIKLLVLLFITTVIVTFMSFAKYKSTMAQTKNTKVAVPIVNMEGTIVLEDLKPGVEKQYEFNVNNGAEEISQTTMKYTIKIETKSDLPLIISLHEKQENLLSENLLDNSMTTGENIITCEEATQINYVLKVKWDDTYKSYKYASEIDYINIIIDSEQVD